MLSYLSFTAIHPVGILHSRLFDGAYIGKYNDCFVYQIKQTPCMLVLTEKDSLRWHLQVIFLYYASYADRNNYKLLKTQNYRRFLIDSETVIDQASFPPFDIAFRKIHTTSISHQQFQELIPNIAQLIFPSKKRKEAFDTYVSQHLEKLYHEILYKSDFGADVLAIERLRVQQKSLELLQSIPLRKAYFKYIQSTAMHQKNPEQTFEHLHTFLTEFEISPKLIYKAMTYLIFFYLLKTKDNPSKYGLEDFKNILICIAELYWRKIDSKENSQQEKVLLIMQQMQLSAGFKKMVDKTLKESAVMVSFFKRNNQIRLKTQEEKHGGSVERQHLNDSLEKNAPKTAKHQHSSPFFTSAKKTTRREDLGTVRELMELGQTGVDVKELKNIFERLCSQGQVANIKTLKSIKIKKYFQNITILNPLSQTWLDLKIADLCRSSPTGKIEFPHFLQLLMLASKQLSITLEGLYQYLIETSQNQPVVTTSYSTKQTKDQNTKGKEPQTDTSALAIFYQVQRQLQKIFMHYSQGKRQLSFDKLSHLLYDFDIFPAFISKSRLYKLFQKYGHSRSQLRNLVGEISLDIYDFLRVLHSISAEIGDNLSSQEQVLFMLERMQDSLGHRSILGRQGTNLIGDLRSRYSGIYLSALKKSSDDKISFQELIDGYQP